jgi:hypothetical protein
MRRHHPCLGLVFIVALLGASRDALADPMLPSTSGTIASTGSWPIPMGSHIHHIDRVEVGDFRGFEEERGVVEFDLAGQDAPGTATLSFTLAFFFGTAFDIDLFAYQGNNQVDVSDYGAPSLGYIGRVSSSQLVLGNLLSFDVTSVFTDALLNGALGIRLQAAGFPGTDDRDPVFESFRIDTTPAPVPEPATLFLFGAGAASLLARRRRKTAS